MIERFLPGRRTAARAVRTLSQEEEERAARGMRPMPEGAGEEPEFRFEEPLSQTQLIWRRFCRHKLGMMGTGVVAFLFLLAALADFIGPYGSGTEHRRFSYAPPTPIHLFHEGKFVGPFVYGIVRTRDPLTFETIYTEDRTRIYPIRLFVRGDSYKLLGLFETNIHLFGTGEPPNSPGQVFLFGTDIWGRDLFTRTLIGGRISLLIGPASVLIALIIGSFFGGISGYFGRWVDMLLQRVLEVLQSFPTLPLLLALSAILPPNLPNSARVFGIILIFGGIV